MRDNLTIRGMQYIPDGAEIYPAVIMSHGFTGNYLHMADYCEAACAEGYAAFCFSFCGGGSDHDAPEIRSDGDSRDMCISSEVADLSAVVEYAKSLPYVNAARIVLMGGSQGGFVSGLTAARYGDAVRALIMLYPALCIPDHARAGRLGGASYDPQNVPQEIPCAQTVLGKKFHDDVCNMNPFAELARYKNPVLLIQGTADTVVDPAYSVRARDSYAPGQCRLHKIDGMTHWANAEQNAVIVSLMKEFLRENI